MTQPRQLAAIMFTDIVGYTSMMQQNEKAAVAVIKHYTATLEKWVKHFNGQVLNYYGDGSLCIFSSATDAVSCSMVIQRDLKSEPVVPLRIGLHIGEVFFEDAMALGDAVNVASRVQSLGQENTILLSEEVYNKIKNNDSITTKSLGHFDFKNVGKPMEVFALTNEGLFVPQRKKMDGKLKKNNARTKHIISASVVLIVVLAGLFFYKNLIANNPSRVDKSIAVLPFIDLSANKDQEYFSDGLSEELLNLLSNIPDLKVIGRTSSFSFKGKNEDLRTIAEKLGVAHILEGSVRKDGNKIRVTTQLIRAADASQLWSHTYDRNFQDIFKLQDDIAGAVVQELKLKLLEAPTVKISGTGNPEAYNLILQGNYFFDKLDKENVAKAVDFYTQALNIDSTDARAWGKLANAISRQTWQNYIDRETGRKKAKEAVLKSIALDKSLAVGYLELGDLKLYQDLDWSGAEENYRKALSLEPGNTEVTYSLGGGLYFATGRWNQAIKLLKECIETDPLKPLYYLNLGNILAYAGRHNEAIKHFKKALELNPEFQRAHMYLGRSYLLMGKPDEALKEMQQENMEVFKSFGMALAYHAANKEKEANEAVEIFKEKFQNDWHYLVAELYAFRGEKDKAFVWLERAFDEKDGWLVFFKGDPLTKKLQKDPRYSEILTRMHLPAN